MMNEILGQAARFQQLLSRKFGIIGGAPSPQLTPEVTPEFGLPTGPEDRILASDFLAAGRLGLAGAVATTTQIALWNPPGSNILLVVERIAVMCTTAGSNSVFGGITLAANQPFPTLPAVGGKVLRDTRVNSDGGANTRPPVAILCGDNAAPGAITPSLFFRTLAQYEQALYDAVVVVAPGWHVGVRSNAVNMGLDATFAWREVPLASGEVGPF